MIINQNQTPIISNKLELEKRNIKQIESKKIKKIVFIYEDQSFEEYSR